MLLKFKIKVYHGTDLYGCIGIISKGFNENKSCATPSKKEALGYSKPFLISFKYDYCFSIKILHVFIYRYFFNKQMLTVIVRNIKPPIKIVNTTNKD